MYRLRKGFMIATLISAPLTIISGISFLKDGSYELEFNDATATLIYFLLCLVTFIFCLLMYIVLGKIENFVVESISAYHNSEFAKKHADKT